MAVKAKFGRRFVRQSFPTGGAVSLFRFFTRFRRFLYSLSFSLREHSGSQITFSCTGVHIFFSLLIAVLKGKDKFRLLKLCYLI